ncbi:hypothetical protein ACOKW7_21170 [Limnospira platensis CENA597]|uniref:hypothetical protein n=1 Tax=Limnospira platensis TaxID=118562 RepID=UPI003DA1646E
MSKIARFSIHKTSFLAQFLNWQGVQPFLKVDVIQNQGDMHLSLKKLQAFTARSYCF